MINTGSRTYFALGAAAFLLAVLYGVVTATVDVGIVTALTSDGAVSHLLGPLTFGYKGGVGDHAGYAALMGFAGVSFGIGAMTTAFRDANAESLEQIEAADRTFSTAPPMAVEPWPMLTALSAGIGLVGLALSPALFVIGLIGVVLCGAEWTLTVWADRATADPEVNRAVRRQVLWPLEIPVGVVAAIAVVVLAMSRLFLATGGLTAALVAAGIAAVVLIGAFLIAARPSLNRGVALVLAVVVAAFVIGAGIWGALADDHSDSHTEEGAALVGTVGSGSGGLAS